jgi:hypothetical protein
MTLITKYNLGLKKLLPEFTSNGRSVSLGSEVVIQVGAGANEYMSFGDLAIDDNGKLHLVYRQASGHNDAANGTVRYRTSVDGGATWTSATTIIPDTSDAFNITNPAITITSTGRILVFFTKQDWPTSSLTQLTYLIYSDNGGTTWNSTGTDGNEILINNTTAYQNIIGHAIALGSTLILPMYSRVSVTSGNEFAYTYKSVNDGLTWTFNSNITDGTSSTILNAGETNLLERGDGLVMAFMRNNGASPATGNYVSWSRDGGVKWLQKPYQAGTLRSKNAVAISPNGTILTVGRDNSTNYTMYGYSSDGGATFTYARIDSREGVHEYSGIVWDSFNNRFVVVYYVETGVTTDSPTDIVLRYVNEV